MKRSSYRELEGKLEYRESFIGNSVTGVRNDRDKTYDVYSYSTVIMIYSLELHRVVYFDDGYYSSTTSRIQNILKRHFPTWQQAEKLVERN